MKQPKHAIMDLLLVIVEYVQDVINYMKGKRRPQPTLLAYNIDWFTYSTWIERLIAFKRVNTHGYWY